MKLAIFGRLLLSGMLVVVSGCASYSVITPDAEYDVSENSQFRGVDSDVWRDRESQLQQLESWSLKGRLGVKTNGRGGSATFLWHREGSDHEIELYGPFGGGRVIINQNSDGAVLRDNQKNVFRGDTAQALLYTRLGWEIPFDALQYWMSGLPAPVERDVQIVDDSGLLQEIAQLGWSVEFKEYTARQNMLVPRKIIASALPGTVHVIGKDGQDLGDRLDVKLVVKNWQYH